VWGKTAPILSNRALLENPSAKAVDPVPQALVLTAIVIGVAVLALALSIVMRIYETHGTLNVDKIKELRW
jgi:multisubunit Na+/H+ antiporter MnhC subunit